MSTLRFLDRRSNVVLRNKAKSKLIDKITEKMVSKCNETLAKLETATIYEYDNIIIDSWFRIKIWKN